MECGLRIPVFVYSLIILEDLTSTQRHKLLQAIYLHAWWVYHRLSLYASLGNHTICECAGLIFSGVVFRDNAAGEKWLDRGRELLTAEAEHQILRDGGSSEQACNYHRFILDLYQLVYDFLRKNRIEPIAGIKAEFVAGEFFLEKMGDADVGDSDDGFAIAPCLAPKRVSANSKSHALTAFDTSGYSIINSDRVKLIFDHGPLGMPPLYNHGHADALSITLRVEDCPILIDPGTYRYNGVSEWRQYFKGTRAHNTVTIDGKDQAVQRTGFIWSHPYECTSIESRKYGGDISLVACHDGYRRLREPVRHFRRIKFFYPNYLVISDWFRGKGTHTYEVNFHLHPDVRIEKRGDMCCLAFRKGRLFLKPMAPIDSVRLRRGDKREPLGWYSPNYGIKQETYVISYLSAGFPHEIRFDTLIYVDGEQNRHIQ